MFAFTLQIAMATVTMEILRSFVRHHFLSNYQKTIYSGQQKLCDYSVVFIVTNLVAVYLYKASMPFFFEEWVVGRATPNRASKMP